MENKFKVIFIHHRSPHHSKHSGYSQLTNYLEGHTLDTKSKFPYRLAQFIANIHNERAGIYSTESFLTELSLIKYLRKNQDEIHVIHFLNAERNVRHLVRFKKLFPHAIFCGTFHKPPKILDKKIKNWKYLRYLDGAISVGANQVNYLKQKLENEKVRYIPHGINTDFFVPSNKKPSEINKRLLFVGQHLRDFKAFNNIIPKLLDEISGLEVNVVMHKWHRHRIDKLSRICIRTRITDEELLKEYQAASLLFIPMTDSTACNSILEAMSCGLPVITTNVGGNYEYLDESGCVIVQNNDFSILLNKTKALINNDDLLKIISETTRKKALKYDWKNIAKSVNHFHNDLYKSKFINVRT